MKISEKIFSAQMLLRAKLLGKRFPIIVSWALTYRCNYRCAYCATWNRALEELDTQGVLSLIDQIAQMGTRRIHFTGGEPLLKEDIEVILSHCRNRGIAVALNSNGSLVPKKIQTLSHLNLLSLSLDGPEEVHDLIRGKGSYREVMEAVEIAKHNNIKVRIITVLSKLNLDSVDFVLRKAKELKVLVTFQPASLLVLESKSPNSVAPLKENYITVINKLLKEKKRNKYIGNSLSGLRHLYNWPGPTDIPCVNSLIFCRIEPDGNLYGCASSKETQKAVNCATLGFEKAFNALVPAHCKECWCAGNVELNCLFNFKPNVLFNAMKFI